jgi:PAS domain S-box-containing protein
MKLFPRWMKVNLAILLCISCAGGVWFYRTQESQLRKKIEDELADIADLKANEIAHWRIDQLGEGDELISSFFFAEGIARWLADPQNQSPDSILNRFHGLQMHHHYQNILLVNPDGKVLLSLEEIPGTGYAEVAEDLATALRGRKPVLTEWHRCGMDAVPHVSLIVPLFSIGAGHSALGAVILLIEGRQYLYPLIKSWPTPSRSAETLLVRREKDAVLYLNDLRFLPNAALELRMPLSQKEVPSVMAVLGKKGIVTGKDYRGAEVIAAVQPVPNSPWFIISKMDIKEAFAEWRFRSIATIGLIFGIVILETAGAFVVWQRNQKAHFRALYQSEKTLREREARHGITLRSIGEAVIVMDAAGRIELLNECAETLTGWTNQEARGKALEQVIITLNEESRRPAANSASRVLQMGTTEIVRDYAILAARDGTERCIARSAAGIFNERNEIIGAVLVFRDQTPERLAQRALQEQERKFREIVTFLDEGYCSVTMDDIILECNPAFNHILGFEPSHPLKGTALDLWRNPDERGEYLKELTGRGFVRNYLVNAKTIRGEEIAVMVNAHLVRGERSEPVRIEGTFTDVTDRKHAEDALKKLNEELARSNKELEQFAYIVSHDLQDPLRTIASYVQLFSKRYCNRLDQDGQDFIQYIVDGASRMQRLIRDLLSYARVTTRGSEFHPVSLQKAMEEAASNLQSAIDESNAELTNDDMPIVTGDYRQLVQVFQNLIGNAIKFRKKDQQPCVHISADRVRSEWIISVKDNGIGIDPQYFNRLFTVFQRLHRREEYPGTGIGLAICQKIIARHKGRIWVESTPGQGTRFCFSLIDAPDRRT